MKSAMFLCALLLTGCASFAETWQSWSRLDRTLYDASVTCAIVDYLQTESALDTGKFKEANPLFGEHPSDERLAAITGVRLGAHWYLAENVPEHWRTETFSITLAPCLITVIHNHQVGVRIEL